jgi:hypothetical protein
VLEALELQRLPRITLAEVLETAAATTRVDRKYVVASEHVREFLGLLPDSTRLLSIDGRLTTSYRSTYFDTPDLQTCRAHVQGRRRRWKARSRLYVEDDLCRLELKVRDGGGVTSKSFHQTPAADYGLMTPAAHSFFRDGLRAHRLEQPEPLAPAMEIVYERVTLADARTGTRTTIDAGTRAMRHDQAVEVDAGLLIVETKGDRTPGAADRILARLRVRPVSFSKYAAASSLVEPGIPDNDVRHMLGHELHVTSSRHDPRSDLRRTA